MKDKDTLIEMFTIWAYKARHNSIRALTTSGFKLSSLEAETVFEKSVSEMQDNIIRDDKWLTVDDTDFIPAASKRFHFITSKRATDQWRSRKRRGQKNIDLEKAHLRGHAPDQSEIIGNEELLQKELQIKNEMEEFIEYVSVKLDLTKHEKIYWRSVCSLPPYDKTNQENNLNTIKIIYKELLGKNNLGISSDNAFTKVRGRFHDKLDENEDVKEIALIIIRNVIGPNDGHSGATNSQIE